MVIEALRSSANWSQGHSFGGPRTVASYERELKEHRFSEIQLREALAGQEALLRRKDELIRHQEVLTKESDHRLLNGLQMIVSLLSLQKRRSKNAEVSSQLALAVNRVAMIERVHRRLHCLDGVKSVAFKEFLEELCRDFSTMLSTEESPHEVVVEGTDATLPTDKAIPLSFIVSELIMNAAKYGEGRIIVRLEPSPVKGYALSVSNDGPALPKGFDPTVHSGLGMRIIGSLVGQLGGELQFGRSGKDQGARFTVLFP